MDNKEILNKIKNLSYEELINIVNNLTSDEIIELSNIIGYPVFTRLCMGVLKHKFVLLQDGAAAVIVTSKDKYCYKVGQIEISGGYQAAVKN